MSKDILQRKRILTKASSGSSISTPVSVANGGTGLSSYAVGDIIYASGTTTLSKLAIGTANQQLRVNAGATALEYFTPSGVTGSGAATRIAYWDGTSSLTSSATDFYFQSASPYAHVFAAGRTGTITGLNNSFFGREAGKLVTTGDRNTFFGSAAGAGSPSSTSSSTLVGFLAGGNNPGSGLIAIGITTGAITSTGSGVAIGNDANVGNGSGNTIVGPSATTIGSGGAVAIGANAVTTGAFGPIALGAYSTATQSGAMALGYGADATHVYSIAFGHNAATTAANQLMVGNSDASFGGSSGITDICFGNGDAATSAASPTIRATSGSGTNNAGANLTLAAGKSTGSATPAVINFQSTAAGASSSTAQTLATVLQITNSTTITTSDAVNYALGSTTGTKFGTATTQKLAFWNATPIVQPSGATQAAPAAYATGAFGLDSDANMQALYDLVVAMRTALVNVGIMKGSA